MSSGGDSDARRSSEGFGGPEVFVTKDFGWRASRKVAGELASQAELDLSRRDMTSTDVTSPHNLRSLLGRASAETGSALTEDLERVVRATLELFAETAATGQLNALKTEFPEGFFPGLKAGSDTSDNARGQ